MTDERRHAVRRVFIEGAELSGEAREVALAEACGDDAALRAEVEALLQAEASAGGFTGDPASRATVERAAAARNYSAAYDAALSYGRWVDAPEGGDRRADLRARADLLIGRYAARTGRNTRSPATPASGSAGAYPYRRPTTLGPDRSNTSPHQSCTLPAMPRTPYGLSSTGWSITRANAGCPPPPMLHRSTSNPFPQGKLRPSTPRAAFSHSSSPGRRHGRPLRSANHRA